jgi:hypothetical protein
MVLVVTVLGIQVYLVLAKLQCSSTNNLRTRQRILPVFILQVTTKSFLKVLDTTEEKKHRVHFLVFIHMDVDVCSTWSKYVFTYGPLDCSTGITLLLQLRK